MSDKLIVSSFKENRGRKKKYGALSDAHNRITELRYLKDCQNALLENGAWHNINWEDFKQRHGIASKSDITTDEYDAVKKIFKRRQQISAEILADIKLYFDEIKEKKHNVIHR